MATVNLWSNVDVSIQSTLATAQTITAITLAAPAVVSVAAHGYTNGDFVWLKNIQGMPELSNRLFRVANSTTGTFELEGSDTSALQPFVSGSVELANFNTNINTITDVSSSGGDFDFIDTTTIHDDIKKEVPGAASALKYEFDNIWDVDDAGLKAMKAASDVKAQRAIKFVFPTGKIMVFGGYIGASLIPSGSAQDKVTTKTTVTASGSPTYY